ncbi:MAG: ABC transporter substrate-binding protein [Solirubrobacteraceae bacterium]
MVAAAAALFGRMKLPRGVPVRTAVLVVGAAVLGIGAGFLVSLSWGAGPSLTIYSSLPRYDADGNRNKRTEDMEEAIRFALDDRGGKAGKFDIDYKPLDSTDKTGAFLTRKIQENARIAAGDDATAVYIGDFSSSASIESIPILSRAGIPQISPSSTRVGLTSGDALSDIDEPDQYYRGGSRNFVRVIPNDDIQAAALRALMKKDRCSTVAIIYDGQDYSQGLAVLMGLIARPRRTFSEDVRPNERSERYEKLARKARKRRADCFLYMGADNPNTFGIYDAFANALPNARLYGTDGVSEASLTDAAGNLAGFANRVRLMVPPRNLGRQGGFRRKFAHTPDPYAVYAYETMMLALDAIEESGSGEHADILERLTSEKERDSLLGTYSIDSRGDTNLVDSNYLTFEGGEPKFHRTAGQATLRRNLEFIRERK